MIVFENAISKLVGYCLKYSINSYHCHKPMITVYTVQTSCIFYADAILLIFTYEINNVMHYLTVYVVSS